MILFPDTNFFLQFRDATDIPWSELTAAPEVRLLVCRTVLGEIDDLKAGGNTRRADRARKTSSRFREIMRCGNPLVLCATSPRVTLEIAPRVPHGHPRPASLDPAKKDDRIVAEVLAYHALTGQSAALLSDDTGILLTAQEEGLAFVEIPEAWRRPPEPDARDKQLMELKRQVERLSQSSPRLELKVTSHDAPVPHPLPIRRVRYAPLAANVVGELAAALCERFPMKTNFSREADPRVTEEIARRGRARDMSSIVVGYALGTLGPLEWHAPTEERIAQYRDDYAAWLDDTRRFLERLHDTLPGRSGTARLSLSLTNDGTVPAERVLVDIDALDGLLLAKPPKDRDVGEEEDALALPTVPEAPAWKSSHPPGSAGASMAGALQGIAAMNELITQPRIELGAPLVPYWHPEGRDPHAFYWRDRPVHTRVPHWGFECADFRHGGEAEVFQLVVVTPAGKEIERGAVRFRASARNLPERFERIVEVRVETDSGDTEAAARAMMPTQRPRLRFKSTL